MRHGTTGTLGGRIKTQMIKAGYPTPAHLARAVGRDRKAVCRWIDGDTRPQQRTLDDLAKLFGVSRQWLEHGGTEDVAQLIEENRALKKRIETLNRMINTFIDSNPGV